MRLAPMGICIAFCLFASVVWGEVPAAPQLLPARTLGIARIRNVPDTLEKYKTTAMGRILQDDQVGPLFSKLYKSAQEEYQKIEEQIGVPMERLMAIPHGEAWLALVPSATGGEPGLILFLDVKTELLTVQKLLDKGEALLLENGGKKSVETFDNVRVNIFTPTGVAEPMREKRKVQDNNVKPEDAVEIEVVVGGQGTIAQFEKEGCLVLTSTVELAQEIVTNWSKKNEQSLASNERYAAVMNRCATGNDAPELEWYIDPIATTKVVARNNFTLQTSLALFPALGLDGLQAIGGTYTLGVGEFDETHHVHLLLENPRSGVLDLFALTAGDKEPEPWMPADVVSYMSLQWDVRKTYENGTKLYDSFLGEGKGREEVTRRVKDLLDIDFETELLAAIEGRMTFANWMEPPARLNSQCNLLAIKLLDAKAFAPTLEKIAAKQSERLEKKTIGSTTYYAFTPRRRREFTPEEEVVMRRPDPCGAILGDYLIITDSSQFLEQCVNTLASGKNLAEELDYKLIAGKAARQTPGGNPGAIVFARPEEGMRNLYEMITSENANRQIDTQAENNPAFKHLQEALKEHPLPPFSVLAKYLAPSGGLVTQDETGFHYQAFTLKRK
jgi:hypothetical protein